VTARTTLTVEYSTPLDVRAVVHRVTSYAGEWRSVCGYMFNSYETTTELRPITCVGCVAGLARRVCIEFGTTVERLRRPV
jgi:hypothetical protein